MNNQICPKIWFTSIRQAQGTNIILKTCVTRTYSNSLLQRAIKQIRVLFCSVRGGSDVYDPIFQKLAKHMIHPNNSKLHHSRFPLLVPIFSSVFPVFILFQFFFSFLGLSIPVYNKVFRRNFVSSNKFDLKPEFSTKLNSLFKQQFQLFEIIFCREI